MKKVRKTFSPRATHIFSKLEILNVTSFETNYRPRVSYGHSSTGREILFSGRSASDKVVKIRGHRSRDCFQFFFSISRSPQLLESFSLERVALDSNAPSHINAIVVQTRSSRGTRQPKQASNYIWIYFKKFYTLSVYSRGRISLFILWTEERSREEY